VTIFALLFSLISIGSFWLLISASELTLERRKRRLLKIISLKSLTASNSMAKNIRAMHEPNNSFDFINEIKN
jgi:hypothetical protein